MTGDKNSESVSRNKVLQRVRVDGTQSESKRAAARGFFEKGGKYRKTDRERAHENRRRRAFGEIPLHDERILRSGGND